MSDQPQLDLPPPPSPSQASPRRRRILAGFTRSQIGAGALVLGTLAWGGWVTKLLVTPREDRIVSARLSAIVGDYVQAQARSASPPEQVQAEMRRFMASLDSELQNRSKRGQIVLVGEAVLTQNVPDITDSLRKVVYAAGISQSRAATLEELDRSESTPEVRGQSQAPAKPASSLDSIEDAGAIAPLPPRSHYGAPSASDSTLGGADASGAD